MKARELIQQLLPAACKPPEVNEIKDTLQVSVTSRLEYDVLHELLQSFIQPGSVPGFNRQQDAYQLSLTNLPAMLVTMSLHYAERQADAERLLTTGLQREFNALLKRAEKNLPEEQYHVLMAAVAAADSIRTMLALYTVLPRISHCLKDIDRQKESLDQMLYGKPLVSKTALQPFHDRLDDLQTDLTCCWMFTNYLKQMEYDAIMNLIQRLEHPFVGHTLKDVTAATRKKMRFTDMIYQPYLAGLLDALEKSQDLAAKTPVAVSSSSPAPATETSPLLPKTSPTKPVSYESRVRIRF